MSVKIKQEQYVEVSTRFNNILDGVCVALFSTTILITLAKLFSQKSDEWHPIGIVIFIITSVMMWFFTTSYAKNLVIIKNVAGIDSQKQG